MSDFILRNAKGSELTFDELDGNQSILLTSASTAYRSSSISGSTLKLFSSTSTGSVSSITHSLEIVSSSYAISASYAVSASVEILTEVSSSHAQQADNANSASHAEWADNAVISASIDGTHGHKIDFSRGDGTTFELEIETGSSTDTRDYISNITYTNGDLNFTGEGDAYNSTVDLGVVISSSRHWQEVVKNANILHPTTASLVHEKFRLAELTGSLITLVDSASHAEFADSASAALYTVSGSSTLYAVSASHAINATKYVQTAAIDGTHAHKIDFTRGDGTTFELEIDTGSAGGSTDYISNVQINKQNGGRTYSFVFTGEGNAHNATETLNLNSGIISSSTLSSLTQGTVRQTLNGGGALPAEIDIVGLTKNGSPTFGGITISGSTVFGSSSTSFTHEFTGSTSIDGTLQLGGGDAIGNDITGAFWQGYQISSSKIDFNFSYGYPSLNDEINKKFEKATFDNTAVELTIHNNTGSTVLSTIDNRITGLLSATSSYVDTSGTPVDNDFAKFTDANTIEGRSYSEVRSDLSLSTTDDVTFASGSFKGLTVEGDITANSIITNYVTQSVSFATGSNKFGDESSDKHTFTGSVAINGALDLGGGDVIGNDITGAYWEGYVISASKVDIDVSGFVDTSGTPVDNDYAKFTDANTVEGRSYAEVKSDLGLSTTDDVTFASGSFKGLTFAGNININDYYGGWQGQVISSSKVIHRTVSVDTDGDDSVDNTLAQSETLVLKKGSNITLSEADGVVTIAADNDNVRTVEVDTNGDDSADNTLLASENLRFKKGSNITLAEAAGVITISAVNDNVRTVSVDTDGDDSVENTLETSEDLVFKKGSNITLSEAGGVITIAAANDNTFRTVKVDTDGNGTADNTLGASETLTFKKGSNITLSETDGVLTISAANDNVRTVAVDTDGDDTVENTLLTSEDLVFKKGSNITLSEAGGVITISAANDNVRPVAVDANGDGLAEITLATSEDLVLKKGSNVTLSEASGVVTIAASNTNQLTTFVVEDGDGTEVTISHNKEWKFVEGTGININWTDTSDGTDGDPYDLTIENTAPMTGDEFDNDGTYASLRAQGTTKGDVGLGNVENTALSTYTGQGGALDNQYITNGAGYTTATGTVDTSGTPADNDFAKFTDANTIEGRSYSEVRSDLGLGTIYSKNSTTTVTNGSTAIPDGNAVYDHVTSRLSGYVNKTGTPANQQIPIFTDADTISGSSHLRMHVNSLYPQFGGLVVGDGPDSNLYIGAAIEPSSADVGIRLHSTASGDFYFDFQGDATQTLYFRDYDGSGGSPTKFTFDFQNSDFETATGTFSGNVTANNFVTTSDRELKKDIEPLKDGLETLKKFVSYEYKLDGKKDAGFIAQEVQESLPYAVHTKKDGYLALDTKPIIAHIHKAILEIDQRLSAIEEKLK